MEERNSRKVKIGKVISNKMDKTIVVAIEENKKHPLYGNIAFPERVEQLALQVVVSKSLAICEA